MVFNVFYSLIDLKLIIIKVICPNIKIFEQWIILDVFFIRFNGEFYLLNFVLLTKEMITRTEGKVS